MLALFRPDVHIEPESDAWLDEYEKARVGAMLIANMMYWFRSVHKAK